MPSFSLSILQLFPMLTALLISLPAHGDVGTAVAAMEDPNSPLVRINTSKGEIFVELHPSDAPNNVAQFLSLAAGEIAFTDSDLGTTYYPRYFDGMSFHRVEPGFIIQAGSPYLNPLGAPPQLLEDEINASALGLDAEMVLLPDASANPMLNITNAEEFAEHVLKPLYQSMGISTPEDVLSQQDEISTRLRNLSIKQLYQLQGYRYSESLTGREITRGSLALANSGPDSNGSEFFISLSHAEHLIGKYTAIGTVVEGIDVMDEIGQIKILATQPSRARTVIYSIEEINQ